MTTSITSATFNELESSILSIIEAMKAFTDDFTLTPQESTPNSEATSGSNEDQLIHASQSDQLKLLMNALTVESSHLSYMILIQFCPSESTHAISTRSRCTS